MPLESAARTRFRWLRVGVGLGLIVWLAWTGAIDGSRLLGLVREWPLSSVALLLIVLTLILTSCRLCLLFAGNGLRLPFGASFRLTLIGAVFSNFLPGSTGGDLVRVYLAARPNAGSRTEIATTLVIDRAIGLLALLVVPVLIAATARRFVPGAESLTGLVVAAMAGWIGLIAFLVIGAHPDGFVRRGVMRMVGHSRAGRQIERVFESIRAHRRNGRAVLAAFGLSLIIQLLNIAIIQLILLANGSATPSWGAALLTPFGMLANSLPLTPGGLGVGEAAFESMFLLAGLIGGAEALLSWRLLTTLVDVAGGILVLTGRTQIEVLAAAGGRVEPPFADRRRAAL